MFVRHSCQKDILFSLPLSLKLQALRIEIFQLVKQRDAAIKYGIFQQKPEFVETLAEDIFKLRQQYEELEEGFIWGKSFIRDIIGNHTFYTVIIDGWRLVGIKCPPLSFY